MSDKKHNNSINEKITIEKRGYNEQDLIKLKHDEHNVTVGYTNDHCWNVKNIPQSSFFLQDRILTQLKNFIVKWSPRKYTSKPTESIPLASSSMFSPAFSNALGTANTANIFGLDDDLTMEVFFEALLEWEASYQFHSGRNNHLQRLLNINTGTDRDAIRVAGELETDGELSWSLNNGRITGTTWTRLLCTVFNLSRMDSLATLANILNMSFENLYQLSSERNTAKLPFTLQKPTERIPQKLYVPERSFRSPCVRLIEQADIYGTARQKIGSILHYQLNGTDFCLPATVGDGVLCMGMYKPTAHFLNQHLMDQHPYAPVILCQDMRTALKLQHLLEETRGHNPSEIIVTAHLGIDVSVLQWNYLHGHAVVLIPAPSKIAMARIKLYGKLIAGAGAQSFRVHKGFLLHSPLSADLKDSIMHVNQTEAGLLQGARCLEDFDRPKLLIQEIIHGALTVDEYMDEMQRLGIFKTPKGARLKPATVHPIALPSADPSLTPATAFNLSDVTLHHTMRPGSYVLIVGSKGAGKTQMSLSACRAIIKGNIMWPLFRGTCTIAGNVAYIDAETLYDEYCENLTQHELASEAGQRFFGLSKFASNLPDFCGAFSLADSNFRDGLLNYLLVHQCRYVFFDNLIALMGDEVTQGRAAQDVIDWIEKLQKLGVCVALVHHKSEYENLSLSTIRPCGSKLFIQRARTVIGLVSRSEILNSDHGVEAVRAKTTCDGLTVGVYFKDSKPAPVLNEKTFWLHLPLGASEWEFLAATGADGKELEIAQVCSKSESDPTVQSKPLLDALEPKDVAFLDSLSSDEKAVYNMTKAAGTVKTANIAQKLSCSDRKARNLTKSLEEKGILEPDESKGSQQGYRLKV